MCNICPFHKRDKKIYVNGIKLKQAKICQRVYKYVNLYEVSFFTKKN